MKTASVRDLRNSFALISRWIDDGEVIEVTKRGRVVAHLLPVAAAKAKRPAKPDIMARLRADFGDFVLSDDAYEALMKEDAARDDQGLR
jgi:antitoxin (DNA-binding transcriptional repressor) of toxin-antitoxin stability system